MSINPSVTEALDSLLAGLDSLRAERDDLTAAQLSGRALAPIDPPAAPAAPLVRPVRRPTEALDAARLLALMAANMGSAASADLAESASVLLRRLLKQRSVLVPRLHDAAPGIRVSPRMAVLLTRLPAGHVCAVESDPQRFLYLTPRGEEPVDSSEDLLALVRAASPVGESGLVGPSTSEMVSVSLPRLPEWAMVSVQGEGCSLAASTPTAPDHAQAAIAWLDQRVPGHTSLLGMAWLQDGRCLPLLAKRAD
ncbi:MAG: hypothetical protein ACO2Z5_00350 [Burkholderiaceae bacterium]|jgi:hypothetical protein